MTFMPTRHSIRAENRGLHPSTARTKSAIRRLNFHFTLVLSAGGEPECAARSLNNRAARPFVWIIHKLVEPNLRRVANRQVALVIKPQTGLAGASGFDRLVGVYTAANGKRAADAARRFRLHRSRRPNARLGARSG